jgi:mannose-6-phosphate isomerase-like protein (cupin superfamily)
LNVSSFAATVADTVPRGIAFSRTIGVWPIASRIVSQIFFTPRVYRYTVCRSVPRLIERPTVVTSAGNKPKQIQEYAGLVNSGHSGVSVARMVSPSGWQEPGQRPEFEEITVVLQGMLRVEHAGGTLDVRAGQAVVASPGEWVRYSTPEAGGAEYVAICLPAFSPSTVHRDE